MSHTPVPQKKRSIWKTILYVFLGILGIGMVINWITVGKNKSRDPEHYAEIKAMINKGDILQASNLADSVVNNTNESLRHSIPLVMGIADTLREVTLKDSSAMTELVLNMNPNEKAKILKGTNPDKFGHPELNKYYYNAISDAIANEKQIRAGIVERDAKLAAEKAGNLFSSGQNAYWNTAIKEQLKDPSSYEHIKTGYTFKDGAIKVFTRFRAKNSFGALDFGHAEGRMSLDNEVLECRVKN